MSNIAKLLPNGTASAPLNTGSCSCRLVTLACCCFGYQVTLKSSKILAIKLLNLF